MITLTNPAQVNSVLGGNTPVGYDRLVFSPINTRPQDRRIDGQLRLSSSTLPQMEVIIGQFSIDLPTQVLLMKVDQLNIVRRISLTVGQVNAVQNIINDSQNALESGFITLGIIAGVQTTGV